MLSLHLEKNLVRWGTGQEILDYLEDPEVVKLYEDLWTNEFGEERFVILDEREGTVKALEGKLETMASAHGCKIFVIDVLTDLVRNLPREQQSEHMSWQKNFVKDGNTIFNVLHTKKPSKDKDGKPYPLSEYDAYGDSTLVQSAAINIIIERDKESNDPTEQDTTYVRMPKCRGGTTGPVGAWYYDQETRKVYDKVTFFGG